MPQELGQRRWRRQIAAVRAEMDAGQRDLLEPRRGDAFDLAEHRVNRHAPWHAAGRRDDAVRTRLAAAGLDSQRERRAAGHARLDGGAAGAVAVRKPIGGGNVRRSTVRLKPQSTVRLNPDTTYDSE